MSWWLSLKKYRKIMIETYSFLDSDCITFFKILFYFIYLFIFIHYRYGLRHWWLSYRVSALQSVVAGSISSGGDFGILRWWDLIRSKQQSSVPYVVRRCLADFLVRVIQFTRSIPLNKRIKICNIVVSDFEIHSRYYVHFQTYSWKRCGPPLLTVAFWLVNACNIK